MYVRVCLCVRRSACVGLRACVGGDEVWVNSMHAVMLSEYTIKVGP